MSIAITSHRASLLARVLYAVAAAVTPRFVQRLVRRSGGATLADSLTRLGSRVNAVSRLQRRRPFWGIRFTPGAGADVPVEVVRRADCTQSLADGAILYFHGGGFITGGLDSHMHVMATFARRTRLPVVHVDYRQYPQATVDTSVDDCVAAYRWLLDQGADPAKTVLAGDSAGGFLAFATALAAQQRGLPAPAGVIGMSAVLELDDTARKQHENLHRDGFGIPLVLTDILELACPSAQLRHDLSPINGPLELMPPTLMVAAEPEILRCDAERLHRALLEHGRPSQLEIWDSELHGFPALFPFLSDSRAAYAVMCEFAMACVARGGRAGETRREVS